MLFFYSLRMSAPSVLQTPGLKLVYICTHQLSNVLIYQTVCNCVFTVPPPKHNLIRNQSTSHPLTQRPILVFIQHATFHQWPIYMKLYGPWYGVTPEHWVRASSNYFPSSSYDLKLLCCSQVSYWRVDVVMEFIMESHVESFYYFPLLWYLELKII